MRGKLQITSVNERIDDLINRLGYYSGYFRENNPFSGPSEYFCIIDKVKNLESIRFKV